MIDMLGAVLVAFVVLLAMASAVIAISVGLAWLYAYLSMYRWRCSLKEWWEQ
jgi:hypothetical protein